MAKTRIKKKATVPVLRASERLSPARLDALLSENVRAPVSKTPLHHSLNQAATAIRDEFIKNGIVTPSGSLVEPKLLQPAAAAPIPEGVRVDGLSRDEELETLIAAQKKDAAVTGFRTVRKDAARLSPLPKVLQAPPVPPAPVMPVPPAPVEPPVVKAPHVVSARHKDMPDEMKAEWTALNAELRAARSGKRKAINDKTPTNKFTTRIKKAEAALDALKIRYKVHRGGSAVDASLSPSRSVEFAELSHVHRRLSSKRRWETDPKKIKAITAQIDEIVAKKKALDDTGQSRTTSLSAAPAAPSQPPIPEPKVVPMPTPEPIASPAKLTPETKFKINRVLDDLYISGEEFDQGYYVMDGSDQKTAESMNLPIAWIREVRENRGADVNEAKAARSAEIAAISKALDDVRQAREEADSEHRKRADKLKSEIDALADIRAEASRAEQVVVDALRVRLEKLEQRK